MLIYISEIVPQDSQANESNFEQIDLVLGEELPGVEGVVGDACVVLGSPGRVVTALVI